MEVPKSLMRKGKEDANSGRIKLIAVRKQNERIELVLFVI